MKTKNLFKIYSLLLLTISCKQPDVELDPSVKLREIRVSCEFQQAPQNVYFPCKAMGLESNGNLRDVTQQAEWQISDQSVAKLALESTAQIRGLSPGVTQITARIGAIQGQALVTVTNAVPLSLMVTPQDRILRVGDQQEYSAICVFSDNSYIDVASIAAWNSQDPMVASVALNVDREAIGTALSTGSTIITATFEGLQASARLTSLNKDLLYINIAPSSPTVIKNLDSYFTATGVYTDFSTVDLTSQVLWSVGDGTLVSITTGGAGAGHLLALNAGVTTVTAVYGGLSDTTDVTITDPVLSSITLAAANPSLAKGLSQVLTATGHYSDGSTADVSQQVTWSSLNTAVMSVSNAAGSKGTIVANGVGSTTLSASFLGVSGSTSGTVTAEILSSLTITPGYPSLPLGTSQSLSAMGTYSDGTIQDLTASATWLSADVSRVVVGNGAGNKGLVSTVSAGSSVVSATVGSIVGQTTVVVLSPVLTSIAITPVNSSVAKGLTVQYNAVGTYSDGSQADITSHVLWESASTSIATISNTAGSKGLAQGAGVGATTIKATLSGVSSASASFTVTAPVLVSITVTPPNTSFLILLQQVQFMATGHYSDGSTQDITNSVTWASSNTLTATISNANGTKGRATGLALGTTTITATATGGIVGSTQLSGTL